MQVTNGVFRNFHGGLYEFYDLLSDELRSISFLNPWLALKTPF